MTSIFLLSNFSGALFSYEKNLFTSTIYLSLEIDDFHSSNYLILLYIDVIAHMSVSIFTSKILQKTSLDVFLKSVIYLLPALHILSIFQRRFHIRIFKCADKIADIRETTLQCNLRNRLIRCLQKLLRIGQS